MGGLGRGAEAFSGRRASSPTGAAAQGIMRQREPVSRICHFFVVRYTGPMDEKILEREAMRLPVRERALLADALLESLDDDAARNVQLAWAEEAEDRIEAYRRGEISAVDGPSSLKELRSRYRA